MQAIETIKKGDLTLKLYQDEDAQSPRENDNLGTIVYWHRRYTLGEEDGQKVYGSPNDFLKHGKEHGLIMLPVALLDHSGLRMWIGSKASVCDPGGWDSGQVGWIYVTPEKVREEYSCKRITKGVRETVLKNLQYEIEAMDQFLSGDVYGFVIEDKQGEHVDSCWGFFGLDYAISEAKDALNACAAE